MTTTNNITTSTVNMNIYNNTDQIINPNMYIPTKVCKTCRIIKYVTEFYKETARNDGYQSICKNCDRIRKKNYYKNNKAQIIEDQKEYQKENKDIIAIKKRIL